MTTFLPRRWKSIRLRLIAAAGFLLAVCAILPTLAAPRTSVTAQAARYHVYLALTVANKGATTPPPAPTPPASTSGALFMQPEKKVAGPSLKVDAQGGMHMVYYDAVPLAEKPAATY